MTSVVVLFAVLLLLRLHFVSLIQDPIIMSRVFKLEKNVLKKLLFFTETDDDLSSLF